MNLINFCVSLFALSSCMQLVAQVNSNISHCSDSAATVAIQSFQDFSIRTYREQGAGAYGSGKCIQVSRRGNVLYRGYSDGGFTLLNSSDDTRMIGFSGFKPALHPLPVGTDVTGLGKPELLIMDWSGGNHCCFMFDVLELSDNVRLVLSVDAQIPSAYFADLRKDGQFELVSKDLSFDFWHGGRFQGTPIILRFRDGRYILALDLMRKPLPSDEAFRKIRAGVRSGEWSGDYPPSVLTDAMLDLIFTGHPKDAWTLASNSWVSGHVSKESYLQDFCKQLALNPYYSQLRPSLGDAPCILSTPR